MTQPHLHSKFSRWFFFWTGIIATVAYRIINILGHYNQQWVLIAWYIGTIGFILYFAHRYQISERRAKVIQDFQLTSKVEQLAGASEADRQALLYVLHSLESSKEKWNYIVIFVVSGLALAIGIYSDFLVK